jgi:hypothetical protein
VNVSGTLTGLKGLTGYHFRLVASNSSGTSYGVDHVFSTPDWRPIVTTDAAIEEGRYATFGGTIDGQGLPTKYRFEYGYGGSYYPWAIPIQTQAPARENPRSKKSETAAGIRNQYQYRLVATNDDGDEIWTSENL